MPRQYKKWSDHSPRWQREKSRQGLDKKRWDAWLKLSDATRKSSDPNKYAAGTGIASQRKERKAAEVARKLRSIFSQARPSTVKKNVGKMSEDDLNWTLKATKRQIEQRAGMKPSMLRNYTTNPWWYR